MLNQSCSTLSQEAEEQHSSDTADNSAPGSGDVTEETASEQPVVSQEEPEEVSLERADTQLEVEPGGPMSHE